MASSGDIKAGGAFIEINGNNQGALDAIEGSEAAFRKFKSEATRIADSLTTPLEKLQREMAKIQALGAKGYLDPVQTERGIAAVKKQIDDLGKTDKLKGLKSAFGEESALGNVAKILQGAGAVAGIAAVARGLESATGKALELKQQFAAGKISAIEFAMEIAKSVPILGDIVRAGENINEIFTGDKGQLEIIRQADALQGSILTTMHKVTDEIGKQANDYQRFVDKIKAEIDAIGLTGTRAALAANATATAAQIDQLRDEKGSKIGSLGELRGQRDTLRKNIGDYQSRTAGKTQVSQAEYDANTANEGALARVNKMIAEAEKAANDIDARIDQLVKLREAKAKDILNQDATAKDQAYQAELQSKAAEVLREMNPQLSEFNDKMKELKRLLERGAITPDVYGRAAGMAGDKYTNSFGDGDVSGKFSGWINSQMGFFNKTITDSGAGTLMGIQDLLRQHLPKISSMEPLKFS